MGHGSALVWWWCRCSHGTALHFASSNSRPDVNPRLRLAPPGRHELPTDDQQYERRKEREREEAEERRGAENAVSHNEFLVSAM